jgi:DNA-binding CsgD family transcriptional regulator
MLTAREREVMLLVAEGLSNTKVARQLGISDNTVRVHLQHIYRKLRIRDRTTLAAMTVSSEIRMIKLRRGGVSMGDREWMRTNFSSGNKSIYKGTAAAPSGIYSVLARLPPSENGEFQYRIKHSREPFQLSAKERELKATASSGF